MPLSRAARLTLAFHLSLIPSPLLALKISSPNISTSVTPPSINISWTEESGDPQSIDIQIQCGSSSILDSPIHSKTSAHGTFISRNPALTGQTFTGRCHIQATDGSRLLATSADFLAPQLSPILAATSSSKQNSQSPSKIPLQTTTKRIVPISTTVRTVPPTSPSKDSTINNLSSLSTDISSSTSESSTTSTTLTPTLSTGTQSSITTTPTKISTTIPLPTPTTPTPTGDATGPSPHTHTRAAVIGGVIGGLTFLALLITFGFLHLRRRKARETHTRTPSSSIDDLEKMAPRSTLPSLFHNRNTSNTTANPMIIGEDYHQPEGKRERFLRMQEEMNNARRQRELLRSNLSTRSRRNPNNKEPQRDSEGTEIEERLRQELECMSNRITELETQLTEVVEPPPDYTSSNHA
ncbi:hypothetical protein BDZ94DRAFT_474315 [Collybia nuda]|uniref:Uncharacterized protein n=1 Tax=Collybia nuda TaxID=64659 RepID=A0A9P5YAY2_9AGAR|nr:hypothetical protein BDZ94DRAFT_474315 [Collybia nuda]